MSMISVYIKLWSGCIPLEDKDIFEGKLIFFGQVLHIDLLPIFFLKKIRDLYFELFEENNPRQLYKKVRIVGRSRIACTSTSCTMG